MRHSRLSMVVTAGTLMVLFGSVAVEAALTRPEGPLAHDDSFSVPEDTAAMVSLPGVLANDRTRSNSGVTAVLVTGAAHGVLTLKPNGSLSYTPARDFSGIDVFSYAATDGTRMSEPAIVAITVTAVNDPPVAVDDRIIFRRNAPQKLRVVQNDFDVDGQIEPGTIGIVSPPQNGRVTIGSNGVIIYTPNPGFSGTDAFTYVVWDDRGARSNPALVHLEKR